MTDEPAQSTIEALPAGEMILALRESAQWSLHERSGSRVHASMLLGEAHHQAFGVVHGGMYAVAVEAAASEGACAAVAERGMIAVGTSNTTNFLRPVSEGWVDVVAVALFQGRTQQLWQIDITRREDGKLVARGELRLQNIRHRGSRAA
jgi:1,4-dihydroxy-2-naphthoyl-CoA hydrolase